MFSGKSSLRKALYSKRRQSEPVNDVSTLAVRQRVKSGDHTRPPVQPLTVDVDCLANISAPNSAVINHHHQHVHHRSSSASPHTANTTTCLSGDSGRGTGSAGGSINNIPSVYMTTSSRPPPAVMMLVPSRGLLTPMGRRGSVPVGASRLAPMGQGVYVASRHEHPTVFDFEDWHTALDGSE